MLDEVDSTQRLGLVASLAYSVAQHDRLQPTTTHPDLMPRQKHSPEHTGKAGQTRRRGLPTTGKLAKISLATPHQGLARPRIGAKA